jgi:RNA polymerase sigma-70 factor (ECF subfamily)
VAVGRPQPERSNVSNDFSLAIDAHRRDVVLLCYRFLGSIAEAEDAAQETVLKAWRGRAAFRGDASLRTWLHRIATRVCLDMLRQQRGRRLPPDIGPGPADPRLPPPPPIDEIAWLEPLAGEFLSDADPDADPAARYDLRESVSLAFIAALQVLPPRQRAVLLLRDVLGWSAREAADALDQSVGATESALHRARVALKATHHRTGLTAVAALRPDDAFARKLLDAYVRAWATDDVESLLATMREDVRLAMPPSPGWFNDRASVGEALLRWVFGAMRPPAGYRVRSTTANGQPACVFVTAEGSGGPAGVQVFEIVDGGIADIVIFLDPRIVARF